MLKIYQKKTCVTCKKALAYLDAQGIDYEAIDIEKQPPSAMVLKKLVDPKNIKASLNTRSAIYKAKNLGADKVSTEQIFALMQEDPNLIKRPVLIKDGKAILGFDEAEYKAFLN
ncbi:MAG: arsenate reductase family protein [Vampirovibrionales bacterium]|nr:arsenate reductase family protein [Vampirovibrionales bacterium]